ncbi:MAG: winged helix DNA-binding domain-containing protein [Methanobacteriota archaeon]|nr:MAG: winged helix DNA-binding domain-containing protein [Euryarchaeota archaeon]
MTDRRDRPSFTAAQVAAFQVRRHHLDRRSPRGQLADVVGDVCGVQAQVTAMARIALWARIRPLTIDDVQRALVQRRTIVKTWSLRGALHLHPSKELLLVLGGLMPTRLAYHQRWIRGLGLKEEETTALVLKALEDGPLTRNQLTEFLAKRLAAKWEQWTDGGWGRKTEGSSLSWHLVRPAVVRGLVCFGPNAGQEITFRDPHATHSGDDGTPRGRARRGGPGRPPRIPVGEGPLGPGTGARRSRDRPIAPEFRSVPVGP